MSVCKSANLKSYLSALLVFYFTVSLFFKQKKKWLLELIKQLIFKIISKEVIKNKNPKLTFQTYPSSVSLNVLSQNLFLTFKKCFVGF